MNEQQNKTQIQTEETLEKTTTHQPNRENDLEFLVWATLYNVQKYRGVSFVSLYKTLGISSTNSLWYGPKICWLAGQSQEFNALISKKSRGSYDLTEFGKTVLEESSKKFGNSFKMEEAKRLYEISQRVTVKELKEYAKSLKEA